MLPHQLQRKIAVSAPSGGTPRPQLAPPDIGRRVLGLEGDDAAVHEMVRLRLEETEGRSEYSQLPPFHRVVTIGVAWLDPSSGRFKLGAGRGRTLVDWCNY